MAEKQGGRGGWSVVPPALTTCSKEEEGSRRVPITGLGEECQKM